MEGKKQTCFLVMIVNSLFFCIFVEFTTLWSVVINLTAGFA